VYTLEDPAWVIQLLNHPVDVVGGTVVKKTDVPMFNVKAMPAGISIDPELQLMEVQCVGTGFLRLSKQAMLAIWEQSTEYRNEGKTCRMVFDLKVIDGELISEDNVLCEKWRDTGGKVWIDPSITCNHVGVKKYSGNFLEYISWLNSQELERAVEGELIVNEEGTT